MKPRKDWADWKTWATRWKSRSWGLAWPFPWSRLLRRSLLSGASSRNWRWLSMSCLAVQTKPIIWWLSWFIQQPRHRLTLKVWHRVRNNSWRMAWRQRRWTKPWFVWVTLPQVLVCHWMTSFICMEQRWRKADFTRKTLTSSLVVAFRWSRNSPRCLVWQKARWRTWWRLARWDSQKCRKS